MKKNVLGRVSIANIRKANSTMISRDSKSGRFTNDGKITIKFGDSSKVIDTHITSDKIKEAWSKVIEGEKI